MIGIAVFKVLIMHDSQEICQVSLANWSRPLQT